MNTAELIAIDVHTHAEVSCWNPFDNYGEEYDRAADKYFGSNRRPTIEETVAHYPGRDLLTYTREFAFADPNPLVRFGRKLDLAFRERAQKSSSKYRIAARLDGMLGRG